MSDQLHALQTLLQTVQDQAKFCRMKYEQTELTEIARDYYRGCYDGFWSVGKLLEEHLKRWRLVE